jgi:hypothetical protein
VSSPSRRRWSPTRSTPSATLPLRSDARRRRCAIAPTPSKIPRLPWNHRIGPETTPRSRRTSARRPRPLARSPRRPPREPRRSAGVERAPLGTSCSGARRAPSADRRSLSTDRQATPPARRGRRQARAAREHHVREGLAVASDESARICCQRVAQALSGSLRAMMSIRPTPWLSCMRIHNNTIVVRLMGVHEGTSRRSP